MGSERTFNVPFPSESSCEPWSISCFPSVRFGGVGVGVLMAEESVVGAACVSISSVAACCQL